MKVMVIGATGTIGSAVVDKLAAVGWAVTRVARTSGDIACDVTDAKSLSTLFDAEEQWDAVVSVIGSAVPGSALSAPPKSFADVLNDKLLAQIAVAQAAAHSIAPGGSITLTSGVLNTEPQPGLALAGVANGAVAAFVRSAAADFGRVARINSVSPLFVIESAISAGKTLPPHLPQMTAGDTADAYVWAVRSEVTGMDIDPRRIPRVGQQPPA